MKNIFYVLNEDFPENCVENKAIFGTNYSWLPNELYVRKVAMKRIFENFAYQSII